MKKTGFAALFLASLVLFASCGAPAESPAPEAPEDPVEALPAAEQDPFTERNIYSDDLYKTGIYPSAVSGKTVCVLNDGSDKCSIILPVKHGKIYVVRFPEKTERLRCAVVSEDPALIPLNDALAGDYTKISVYCEGTPAEWNDFMYVPQTQDEYLVIYTGSVKTPVYIGESSILLGHDTDDEWLRVAPAGDGFGGAGSFCDYSWSSAQLMEKLYEPMRLANQGYIERQNIGRDESGKYDMWAYIFRPVDYEQVLFLTAGMHGGEIDAYLGLARFLQLMVSEDGSNAGLHYLRTKVKIIVVPVVNVWSVSETHIRQNSTGMDLNRDFEARTQQESRNVVALLQKNKDEVGALIDFHCGGKKTADLYYQFSIQAANAPLCLKVINHIYEDLKARGFARTPTNLSLIPGKYDKTDVYLQGYAWNQLDIPTLVAEHLDFCKAHSAESIALAAEYFGNFIIQTALAKLRLVGGGE